MKGVSERVLQQNDSSDFKCSECQVDAFARGDQRRSSRRAGRSDAHSRSLPQQSSVERKMHRRRLFENMYVDSECSVACLV